MPAGYHIDWQGEYASQKRSSARLMVIVPITVFLIFVIIYGAFGSVKWTLLILITVLVAPLGGLMALLVTGTHISVSSGVGFLALFGVCVQTGVIMVEYINQLRSRGMPVRDAAIEGSTRRLRPILMTMLVATLGLLPAAMSHAIGSDSQRPFAIVIVGGLVVDMVLSISCFPLSTFGGLGRTITCPLPKSREVFMTNRRAARRFVRARQRSVLWLKRLRDPRRTATEDNP